MLFVGAFFISAPLVLLYTAGYRYDTKKHRVEKTGILQADSIPTGARIVLNDVVQKITTPASFTRILPEDYRVRFEKEGFFPWEKTVEVKSSETTFLTNALLFHDSLPRLVSSNDIAQAAFTRDGRREAILMKNAGQWKELTVLDAGKTTPTLLARFGRDSYSDARLSWSPDGSHLLFSAHDAKGAPVLILYAASGAPAGRALQDGFPASRLDARWSSDGSHIVVITMNGVFLVPPDLGGATTAVIAPGVEDATLRDKTLFLLRPQRNGTVLERRIGDYGTAESLTALPEGRYRFLGEDGPHLLVADARGTVLVIESDDGKIIDTLAADHAVWLAKTKSPRLLAWSGYEITVSDVAAAKHTLVARVSTPIKECAWHPSGLAVFYSTTTGIEAVELDDRDRRNVFDLVHFTDVGAFAVDPTDGVLRFTGAIGNRGGVYEKEY